MSITRLPEIVFPLTQINKVNEIVDVLNDNLNMYFSAQNPALTPVEGVATWTVTHNLGTENVNCSLYNGDNLVISNVSITSDNVVTVSFNATTNIAQDTYKIVIISNGAGSSSGSGSYILPTASTTTLGGVRIDGSSITINNGVISSTVDSSLSDTSTNPVQNSVLYPSLSNFIPKGTIITVKADGSGDFSSLANAVNYLAGKWSNGDITIQIGSGTFNEPLINLPLANFALLTITGAGIGQTTINSSANSNALGAISVRSSGCNYQVKIMNMTINHTQTASMGAIMAEDSKIMVSNIESINFARGVLFAQKGGTIIVQGNIKVSNTTKKEAGLRSQGGLIQLNGTLDISNCTYGVHCTGGGIVQAPFVPYSATSVTNRYSPAKNTVTENGLILGSFTES